MKTATRYATNMKNAVRQMPPAPRVFRHRALPTTTQEVTHYVECLLTKDEQAVCDMATD